MARMLELSYQLRNAVLTPLKVDSGHAIASAASKSVGFVQPGERVDILIELDWIEGSRVNS